MSKIWVIIRELVNWPKVEVQNYETMILVNGVLLLTSNFILKTNSDFICSLSLLT